MKKFLSLVLALVMTMSLVTVSAGAKDFDDGSKITYKEAVDVVSDAGIVDGYTDGSFNPTNTLTRGAAAKIICNLILGPTTAEALSADTAPYTDVPTSNTFAGYIAFCQSEKIISGYADGTFRPAASLTGYAFMKMLLGALGYSADIENYTGSNWSINVGKRAVGIELNDGNKDFVGTKAVTREEACLYAFNTLKATMVEYKDNSTVTVGDITITNNSKATEVERTGKDYTGYNENSDDADSCGTQQFCEKYFSKLKADTTETDDFGRPATKWVYDGEDVGTYADKADKTMVINKTLDADKVVYSDSDYFDYNTKDLAAKMDLFVNGDQKLDNVAYSKLSDVKLQAGDVVEIFENGDNDAETVAVIRYSLAQIDAIETSLSSTYTKKGASVSITLQDLGENGIGGTYYDVYDGDSSKELADFSKDTYEEGTVLAVAMNEAETVLASHVAESVSGKVTAYNSGSKANLTVDGTAYYLHENVNTKNASTVAKDALTMNLNDDEYTLYTDANGYVIGFDESSAVKINDVYYVTGVYMDSSRITNYYAQAVSLADGTVTEFKLKDGSAINAEWNGDNTYTAGQINVAYCGLFTFEKDGSGYNAKIYNSKTDGTYYVFAGSGSVNTGVAKAIAHPTAKIAKDDNSMTIGSDKVYLNDSTNYLKLGKVAAKTDVDVKFVTGGTSVDNTGVMAVTVATKSSSHYVASYVILVSGTAFTNAGSDDVVFIHEQSSSKTSYKDSDGKTVSAYDTELYFLDGTGKKETVTVKGTANPVGFYTWEINDDGAYELTTANNAQALGTGSSTITYKDETGWVGFYADGSDGFNISASGSKEAVKLSGIYNNALSGSGTTTDASNTRTVNFDDVDFSDKVIIADDRGKSTRDNDPYTSEITSVSQLKSAIDKANSDVYAVVYLDDEAVIMVYVIGMTKDVVASKDVSLDAIKVKGVDVSTSSISGVDYEVTLTAPQAASTSTKGMEVTKGESHQTLTFTSCATIDGTYNAYTETATDAIATGSLYIKVKVTAQDTSATKTYVVKVTAAAASTAVLKSSNANAVVTTTPSFEAIAVATASGATVADLYNVLSIDGGNGTESFVITNAFGTTLAKDSTTLVATGMVAVLTKDGVAVPYAITVA